MLGEDDGTQHGDGDGIRRSDDVRERQRQPGELDHPRPLAREDQDPQRERQHQHGGAVLPECPRVAVDHAAVQNAKISATRSEPGTPSVRRASR